MLMDVYFKNMKKTLEMIETTQREAILAAAVMVADSLENGGMWQVLDTGHMLMHEGVGRTGGMMALRPIRSIAKSAIRHAAGDCEQNDTVLHTGSRLCGFCPEPGQPGGGDVLIIGSVSGYEVFPVDVALTARKMGVSTIGFTSLAYSKTLASRHSSGKKLYEVCDIVLDNCANAGDALVPVEEMGISVCPSSGIGAAYLLWALQASVMEELLKRGKTPSVYLSNHAPGAAEHNCKAMDNYHRLAY